MSVGLNLRVEVDSTAAVDRLERYRTVDVPDYRRRFARGVMREVLRRTISRNPVDTGRSRSAWTAALTQLGGMPPAGQIGHSAAAISEGAELGTVSEVETTSQSSVSVTNGVSYVPLLEFGTRSQPAHQMVDRSLAEVRSQLRNLIADL